MLRLLRDVEDVEGVEHVLRLLRLNLESALLKMLCKAICKAIRKFLGNVPVEYFFAPAAPSINQDKIPQRSFFPLPLTHFSKQYQVIC
jgi:hypothetical protein